MSRNRPEEGSSSSATTTNGSSSKIPAASKDGSAAAAVATARIIIALDLDAFYVAASRKRDPTLIGLPVGIKQKHILATVSYEARARGVKKLALVRDAVRQCPELVLVNGEDLSYFREVSAQVFTVVTSIVAGSPVEKLGMDELFIDVTDLVRGIQERSVSSPWLRAHDSSALSDRTPFGLVLPEATAACLTEMQHQESPAIPLDPHTQRLLLATHLARYIRTRVTEDVGLTSSAGIASSKLLAKLVGNVNKPNRQTLFAPLRTGVAALADMKLFLDPYPLRALNGFGSAIVNKMCAQAVKSLGAPDDAFAAGQLTVALARQIFDQTSLETLFGVRLATRLNNLLHARDDEPVIAAPEYPAQISIEDTYQGLPFSEAYAQFTVLAESLLRRLEKELVTYENAGTIPAQPAIVYAKQYRLVMQPYDEVGDPILGQSALDTAPLKVRDYEEQALPLVPSNPSRFHWRRYPLSMRLSIRQGYTNRVSRQTRMPVDVFNLGGSDRKARAIVLANSATALFRAMIAAEGDRGEGLNLINIAALDLSLHRPATSISGFFGTRCGGLAPAKEDGVTSALARNSSDSATTWRGPGIFDVSTIDRQFLLELPEDIRVEIAAQYGIVLEGNSQDSSATKIITSDADRDSLFEAREDPGLSLRRSTPLVTDTHATELQCSTCAMPMSVWWQHDHSRWPTTGMPTSTLSTTRTAFPGEGAPISPAGAGAGSADSNEGVEGVNWESDYEMDE